MAILVALASSVVAMLFTALKLMTSEIQPLWLLLEYALVGQICFWMLLLAAHLAPSVRRGPRRN